MRASDEFYKAIARQLKALDVSQLLSGTLRSLYQPPFPPDMLSAFTQAAAFPTSSYSQVFNAIAKQSLLPTGVAGVLSAVRSDYTAITRDFTEVNRSLARSLTGIAQSVQSLGIQDSALWTVQRLQIDSLGSALRAMSDLRLSAHPIATLPFTLRQLSTITEVEDADDGGNFEAELLSVQEAVVHQIQHSPPRRISFEGWLSLLVALSFFLYGTVSASRAQIETQHRLDSIESLETRILETQQNLVAALNDHMLDLDSSGVHYNTLRKARVQVRPNARSAIVGVLHPGQVVQLESRRGKWIKVSYFDYLEGAIKTGWVLKKYFEMERS